MHRLSPSEGAWGLARVGCLLGLRIERNNHPPKLLVERNSVLLRRYFGVAILGDTEPRAHNGAAGDLCCFGWGAGHLAAIHGSGCAENVGPKLFGSDGAASCGLDFPAVLGRDTPGLEHLVDIRRTGFEQARKLGLTANDLYGFVYWSHGARYSHAVNTAVNT